MFPVVYGTTSHTKADESYVTFSLLSVLLMSVFKGIVSWASISEQQSNIYSASTAYYAQMTLIYLERSTF